MAKNKRIETLTVLIGSHRQLKNSPQLTAITGELTRIAASGTVLKHSGWLLSVLHTTRMLDTTLRELLRANGWLQNSDNSLGDYLKQLRKQGVLQDSETKGWMRSIVDKRNRYMHQAGQMPDKLEANAVQSEMHSCLSVVLAK